jgi:hypothetical protein
LDSRNPKAEASCAPPFFFPTKGRSQTPKPKCKSFTETTHKINPEFIQEIYSHPEIISNRIINSGG